MNNFHKIAFRTHWTVEHSALSDGMEGYWTRISRTFHCPTGLLPHQSVRFCFEPATDVRFSLNHIPQPLTIIKGLATATITGMMQPNNRLEINWRVEHLEALQLPEHFLAWLEISDEAIDDAAVDT